MNDHNKIIESFDKIKATIKSCVNEEHIDGARKMIDNLMAICLNEKLPFEYYMLYVSALKELLKERIKQINK
jgi:hypothetical protein